MSMLTLYLFSQVLTKVEKACETSFRGSKLILLVGDHCQLPSVCHHHIEPGFVCARCHLSNSMHWNKMEWHHLKTSMRQQSDPEYVEFLTQIRTGTVDQEAIDRVIGPCLVKTAAEKAALLKGNITVLYTHNEDVDKFNSEILQQKFPATRVVSSHKVPISQTRILKSQKSRSLLKSAHQMPCQL